MSKSQDPIDRLQYALVSMRALIQLLSVAGMQFDEVAPDDLACLLGSIYDELEEASEGLARQVLVSHETGSSAVPVSACGCGHATR